MILVDTSVWVSYFRKGNTKFRELLYDNQIVIHPFIIGELSLGNLKQRDDTLNLLHDLQQSVKATDKEVLSFIARHRLNGCDIGYVDAHLLASARLTNVMLWTEDKSLSKIAAELNLGVANKL